MTELDLKAIRSYTAREAAQYLRNAVARSSEEDITQQLISAVECGSIPPSIFAIWLPASQTSIVLYQALKQETSIYIRKLALKELQRCLGSKSWKETWDGLGGTQGILNMMRNFSVSEIKGICRAIGRSTKVSDIQEKREAVTELLKELHSSFFSDLVQPNSDGPQHPAGDERPLSIYYQYLVPGCTPESAMKIVEKENWNDSQKHLFLRCHVKSLQKHTLRMISDGDGNNTADPKWLFPLLRQYPARTGSEPGFSSSMDFSLEVLRNTGKDEASRIFKSEQEFITNMIEPLLKRALKKKAAWEKTQEILNLTLNYLKHFPKDAQKMSFEKGGILHLVGQCWFRKPTMFQKQFHALVSHSFENSLTEIKIQAFEPLLKAFPKFRRYKLLKFCLKALKRDIEVQDELRELCGCLDPMFLNEFEASEALDLFTRLRSAKGDAGEWATMRTDFQPLKSVMQFCDNQDGYLALDIWQIWLLRQDLQQKEAEKLAERCLKAQKEKAMSCLDNTERAFHAKYSFCCASFSGSLDMFEKIVDWTRRFVRDSITSDEVYGYLYDSTTNLLSGIPIPPLRKTITYQVLRARVEQANRIIQKIFELAVSVLREPSRTIYPHMWNGARDLLPSIIKTRRRRSTDLKRLGLSDKEVYDILWDDTLELVDVIERKCLENNCEQLAVSSQSDFTFSVYQYPESFELENEVPSTYRFFDNLAKLRDEIWREGRVAKHPVTSTLPPQFPQGLPIQELIQPYRFTSPWETWAPYLASRVKTALFPHPDAALTPIPLDKESRQAIGDFIDHYKLALMFFIANSSNIDERKHRSDLAWAHATGPLSQDRMTVEEAAAYWWPLFRGVVDKDWLPKALVQNERDPGDWPKIPDFQMDYPTEIVEWNPAPPKKPDIDSRSLAELTYIDLSTKETHQHLHPSFPRIGRKIELFNAAVPSWNCWESRIWTIARNAQAKTKLIMREGQILSALLFLDTMNITETRSFSTAFPSTGDIRYPPVNLSDRFLEDGKPDMKAALKALEAHISSVPSILLAQLTENIIQSLDLVSPDDKDGRFNDLQFLAFNLLRLLGKSDKPRLASELVVNTIIRRPEASSWHQGILSQGFLQNLPESEARNCCSLLANGIIANLEEMENNKQKRKMEVQNSGELKDEENKGEETEKHFVKVSTVKLLIQTLRDAEFLSEDFVLSILSNLSEKTPQVDIQRTLVDNLLRLLQTCSRMDLSENIFTCLENCIPIAGNLNERSPISEATWSKAMKTYQLPEIDTVFNKGTAPILEKLIKFYSGREDDWAHKENLMKRILMPTINSLKSQTSKYISIFLQKHGIDSNVQSTLNIKFVPKHTDVWERILKAGSRYTPTSLLEDYMAYMIFNIAPPSAIADLSAKFPGQDYQPDVKFWVALYGNGRKEVDGLKLLSLPQPKMGLEKGSINSNLIRELFLKLYATTLQNDDMGYTHTDNLSEQLKPKELDKQWRDRFQPVVEDVINYVDTLHTPEWERDPNRQPSVLPDIFPLRLWLLGYPGREKEKDGDREANCKALAEEILKLIIQMKIDESSYNLIKRVSQLESALWDARRKSRASADGRLTSNMRSEEKVLSMIQTWKMSGSEEIRRSAHTLEGLLLKWWEMKPRDKKKTLEAEKSWEEALWDVW
ncbi:hypothetical protein ABW20_dc0109037 [Dactylellina cionopaga]|nr:hypothetical protein ABW20_dc0109037 [Dactylellina cionopaga]